MPTEDAQTVVPRFNQEVIAGGDRAFNELMAPGFVNRSAPAAAHSDRESLWNTFQNVLRPPSRG